MTTVCDWAFFTLFHTTVGPINFLYYFWTNASLSRPWMRKAGSSLGMLDRKHISLLPGDPSCRISSYICSELLSCVILLVLSWVLRVPAVSNLYVATMRLLTYLKQFQLDEQGLWRMAALFATLYWMVTFLSHDESECCKRIQLLYIRIPIPLGSDSKWCNPAAIEQ